MAATVISRAQSHMSGATGVSGGVDADMDRAFRQLRSQSGSASSIFMDLEAFIEKTKIGMNNLLHSMTRNSKETYTVFVIGAIIEAGQLAALALPDENTLDMGYPTPVAKFAEILSYTRFGELLWEHFNHFTVAIVILCILLIELLALPYVAYTWSAKETKSLQTKVVQSQMSIFGGIFFIPVISCLAEGAFCSKFSTAECSFFMPIAIVELVIFVVLVLLVSVMYFDSRPKSKSMTARPHARIHVLSVFTRGLLALVFTSIQNVGSSNTSVLKFWSCLCAIMLTLLCASYTWYQPYFHQRANFIRALSTAVAAWLAICSAVHVLKTGGVSATTTEECVYSTDSTITVTIFGGLSLVLPLIWVGIHYRRYSLQMKPANQCSNVYELELKGRLEIQGLGIHHISDLNKADKEEIQNRASRVNQWYMDAATLFPLSGALCMFHAIYLLSFLPNKTPMVRRAIVIGIKRGLSPDFHVIAYKVRRTLEETIQGSSDVLSIVRSEEFTAEALKYDKRCSSQLVEFWSELSEKRPDINKVRRLALKIAVSSSSAHKAYLKLLKNSPKSALVYDMISSFLLEIMHDTRLAAMMRLKGARIAREVGARNSTNLNDVESDALGVIVARASTENRHELGDVIFANINASQILNQVNQMIVGQKIDSILTSPLAETFEDIVDGFFEEGKDAPFEDTIQTFLRTPNGNVVAVNLKLQPYSPDDVTFNMYLIFQADTSHSGENYLVVDETSGIIHGMGSSCHAAFNGHLLAANQRQYSGMNIPTGNQQSIGEGDELRLHISTIIPNFAAIDIKRFPEGQPIPVSLEEEDTGAHILKRFRVSFHPPAHAETSVDQTTSSAHLSKQSRRPSIASLIINDEAEQAARASMTSSSLDDSGGAHGSASPNGGDTGYVMRRADTVTGTIRRVSSMAQQATHVKGRVWFKRKRVLGKDLLQVFLHDPDVPEFNTMDDRLEERMRATIDGDAGSDLDSMGNDNDSTAGESIEPKARTGLVRRTFTDKSEHMRRFIDEMGSEAKITVTPKRAGSRAGSKAGSKAGSLASGEVLRLKAQAVRKMLQDSQNAAMDATLAKLRRMYLRASVLVCICAIIQYVTSTDTLQQYKSDVQFVGSMGFRRYCLLLIAYSAHGLSLIRRGILDSSLEDTLRGSLNTAATNLKTIDFTVFQRRGSIGGDLQAIYEDRDLQYYFMRNGFVSYENMSLFDTTMKISSLALQAEQANLTDFYPGSPLTLPLMENLDFYNRSALYGLEATTEDFQEYCLEHAAEVLHQLYIVACVMGVFTLGLVLLTIYPLVGNGGKIEKVKGEILQVFSDIPKKTTQDVGLRFVERLRCVHEEDVDASRLNGEHPATRSVALDGDHDTHKPLPGVSAGGGGGGGMLGHLTDAADNSTGQTREPRKVAKVAPDVPADRKSAPKPKKSSDKVDKKPSPWCTVRKVVITAKMSTLLFLSIIYFSSTVLLSAKLEWDTHSAPVTTNLAGYRRMKILYTMHEFRLWLTGAYEGIEIETEENLDTDYISSAERVRERLSDFKELHDILLYGSTEYGVTGSFRDSDTPETLMTLYTTNGCLNFVESGNVTQEVCEEFDNGLMMTGLQSAITNYLDAVDELTFDTDIEDAVLSQDDATIRDVFLRDDVQRVIYLEEKLLQPQLNYVVQINNAALVARVKNVEISMLILLVGLIVLALFAYAFIVRAMLSRLDTEVKRTRSLLLVIPEDVLDSLRHIQVFLVDSFSNQNK